MSEASACVFCGEPIGPDQPTAGRPPMAAHATCADAALASDTHWDAIAGQDAGASPEDGPDATPPPATARPTGCLGVLAVVIGLLAVTASRTRSRGARVSGR